MPSKQGSVLMEDLAAIDAMEAAANRLGLDGPPIPVVGLVGDGHVASGTGHVIARSPLAYDTKVSDLVGTAIVSDPVEGTLSDHFRMSSPNRGESDSAMRHRRNKRRRK